METEHKTSPALEWSIFQAQMNHQYRQILMAFWSVIGAVAGCYLALHGQIAEAPLLIWVTAQLTWNFLLLALRQTLYSRERSQRHQPLYHVLFRVQAGFHGLLWGAFTPMVWYAGGGDLPLAFSVMVTIAMAAGAIMAIGAVFSIFVSYMLSSILPPALLLMIAGTGIWSITGTLLLVFLAALGVAGRNYNVSVRNALRLRFINEKLVDEMRQQMQKVEQARNDLEKEVTTRRQAEDSLRSAKQAAEAANEAKSRFLANMSHEIRTPLTAILGFSEMIDEEGPDSVSVGEHLAAIHRNGRHLLQLVNEVLDFSKIEAGHMEVERVPVDLFAFLDEVRATYGYLVSEKGLEFDLNCHFPLPGRIYTDPTRLKQIVFNLLSNALKFTQSGSVTIDVAYTRSSSTLFISVTDTGLGISKEDIGRLFQPFTQADVSTTRNYGGTGLGLSISRRLANLLDGGLEVSTEPGKGSCFTLSLRTGLRDDSEVLWHAPHAGHAVGDEEAGYRFQGRVLLVEDNRDIRTLISSYLRRMALKVEMAENGKVALDMMAGGNFDLVVMDMQMPVMDGLQALIHLRDAGDATPVVILTANAMEEDRVSYLKAGASDVLAKPVDRATLGRMLSGFLPPAGDGPTGETSPVDGEFQDDEDDEEQMRREFRARFLQRLPECLHQLIQSRDRNDYPSMQFLLHDLKGMGGTFGFSEITELSAEAEGLVRSGRIDDLPATLEALEKCCREALAAEEV